MSVTGHLVFDPASLVESANVGSYVRAGTDGSLIASKSIASSNWLQVSSALFDGAGTAITSTSGALDVNLKSPLAVVVDLNGVYNVSTNPTPDSVAQINSSRSATPGLTTLSVFQTGATAASDAVVAANVSALDVNSFLMGYNGTTWDRLQVDGSKFLKVNISASSGTVTVSDAALANTAGANAALTVGTTSISAVASILASRKYLYTFNNGNKAMYLGFGTVTSANGFPMYAGQAYEFRAGAAIDMKVISTAASQDLRTLELS